MMASPRKPNSSFDFGRNLTELEAIVHQLEDGEIELDRAIAQYEKGASIAAELQQYLDQAQLRINRVKASFAAADTTAAGGTAADDTDSAAADPSANNAAELAPDSEL